MTQGIIDGQKPIIAIIGSTGHQGGGLARAILNDPNSPFQVRAFTRDPSKEASLTLQEAGADVVAFDMDGTAQEMATALQGVYGLFVVTNFWEYMDHNREMAQAKAVVEAGEMTGVQHYIWSTLDDTRSFFDSLPNEERPPKVNGTYVPHFDAKGETNLLFPSSKSTILFTSMYMEDLYMFGLVKDGVLPLNLDDVQLPVIAAEDIGKSTYSVFRAGEEYKGKSVHLAAERISMKHMMQIATNIVHKEFKYKNVSRTEFAQISGSTELANMFDYLRLNLEYRKALDPSEAHKLNPEIQSVRDFFETHTEEMSALGGASTK
eukprot:CAMPEP_0168751126 /NCGR_PEP_ID=MMETSP0724-20121128/17654_1 /TAXON_ID=265536 /ORGANISM="Amphiprora sp., Strain CCMP467" /LENGTH=319 /DNA_ID=CAMNT_0008799223 /DNA_START=288 /DNA_END=1247 /DNA_ORIENTATION=-